MSVTDAAPRGAPLDLAPPGERPLLPNALRLLPALAIVAAGWMAMAAMLAPVVADRLAPLAWAAGLLSGGADVWALMPAVATLCRNTGEAAAWPALVAMWLAMAATMLPGAAPGWRLLRTAPDWRDGYGFLAGHLAVWACIATAAAGADMLLAAWPEARAALVPLAAMLAAVHRIWAVEDRVPRTCPSPARAGRSHLRGGDIAVATPFPRPACGERVAEAKPTPGEGAGSGRRGLRTSGRRTVAAASPSPAFASRTLSSPRERGEEGHRQTSYAVALCSRGEDTWPQPPSPTAPVRDGLACGARCLAAHAPLVGLMAVAGMMDLFAMVVAGGAAAVGRRGGAAAGLDAAMLAGFALWRLAAGG